MIIFVLIFLLYKRKLQILEHYLLYNTQPNANMIPSMSNKDNEKSLDLEEALPHDLFDNHKESSSSKTHSNQHHHSNNNLYKNSGGNNSNNSNRNSNDISLHHPSKSQSKLNKQQHKPSQSSSKSKSKSKHVSSPSQPLKNVRENSKSLSDPNKLKSQPSIIQQPLIINQNPMASTPLGTPFGSNNDHDYNNKKLTNQVSKKVVMDLELAVDEPINNRQKASIDVVQPGSPPPELNHENILPLPLLQKPNENSINNNNPKKKKLNKLPLKKKESNGDNNGNEEEESSGSELFEQGNEIISDDGGNQSDIIHPTMGDTPQDNIFFKPDTPKSEPLLNPNENQLIDDLNNNNHDMIMNNGINEGDKKKPSHHIVAPLLLPQIIEDAKNIQIIQDEVIEDDDEEEDDEEDEMVVDAQSINLEQEHNLHHMVNDEQKSIVGDIMNYENMETNGIIKSIKMFDINGNGNNNNNNNNNYNNNIVLVPHFNPNHKNSVSCYSEGPKMGEDGLV